MVDVDGSGAGHSVEVSLAVLLAQPETTENIIGRALAIDSHS